MIWGLGLADSKARNAGTVYRDEAADIMAAAARITSRPAPPELELTARRAPEVEPESSRPLPYPEPVGINDNAGDAPPPQPRRVERRPSLLRRLAWIVIAPLYLVLAVASFGIIALFARGLLGF